MTQINEMFIKHKGQLVDLADVFLSSCQRWLHIVHADMFRERCNAIHFEISQDYFVLLISMGMISRPFLNGTAPDALRLTMYATVKKFFWEMAPLAQPTICLVQAGLLLSVYEYGQGMLNASYMTISACGHGTDHRTLRRAASAASTTGDVETPRRGAADVVGNHDS